MKKLKKLILIIFGACNKVMSLFIPLAVALLWVNATGVDGWRATTMLAVGIASTIFRGLQTWLE